MHAMLASAGTYVNLKQHDHLVIEMIWQRSEVGLGLRMKSV